MQRWRGLRRISQHRFPLQRYALLVRSPFDQEQVFVFSVAIVSSMAFLLSLPSQRLLYSRQDTVALLAELSFSYEIHFVEHVAGVPYPANGISTSSHSHCS